MLRNFNGVSKKLFVSPSLADHSSLLYSPQKKSIIYSSSACSTPNISIMTENKITTKTLHDKFLTPVSHKKSLSNPPQSKILTAKYTLNNFNNSYKSSNQEIKELALSIQNLDRKNPENEDLNEFINPRNLLVLSGSNKMPNSRISELFQYGKFEDLIAIFNNLQVFSPKNPFIFYNMGLINLLKSECENCDIDLLQNAVLYFDRCVGILVEKTDLCLLLNTVHLRGICKYKLGNFIDCAKDFKFWKLLRKNIYENTANSPMVLYKIEYPFKIDAYEKMKNVKVEIRNEKIAEILRNRKDSLHLANSLFKEKKKSCDLPKIKFLSTEKKKKSYRNLLKTPEPNNNIKIPLENVEFDLDLQFHNFSDVSPIKSSCKSSINLPSKSPINSPSKYSSSSDLNFTIKKPKIKIPLIIPKAKTYIKIRYVTKRQKEDIKMDRISRKVTKLGNKLEENYYQGGIKLMQELNIEEKMRNVNFISPENTRKTLSLLHITVLRKLFSTLEGDDEKLPEIIKIIAKISPSFSKLDENDQISIIKSSKIISLNNGNILFSEGQDSIFIFQ